MRPTHTRTASHGSVVVSRSEYEHLARFAKEAQLPRLPEPDARGLYPAIEACRVLTARDIVAQRLALGLTRAELAALARIRCFTLERVESGKHTTGTRTLAKLEAALASCARRRSRRRKRA